MEFLRRILGPIFAKSQVKLAYLFGSHAKGQVGPMSDLDIAILWEEKEPTPMLKSLLLQRQIKDCLGTEKIEVGPLNNQDMSFCFSVISEGECLYGDEKVRVEYEADLLNEYLDFQFFAEAYNRAFLDKLRK